MGKSHTLMEVASETNGMTIFLVPTIVLALDLCNSLDARGIKWALAGSPNMKTYQQFVDQCKKDCPKVIVGIAEYCVGLGRDFFNEMDEEHGIHFVVYEETHCDVLWGRTFRESMLEVKEVFQDLKSTNFVALTATPVFGDFDLMADINNLKSDYFLSKTSLYKENLFLKVIDKKKNSKDYTTMLQYVVREKKTIVFCHFTASCYELEKYFENHLAEWTAVVITGELEHKEKSQMYNEFKDSEKAVLIATKACSFGLDFDNITSIICWEEPDGMEILIQQFGRAAREGTKAKAVIFRDPSVTSRHLSILRSSSMQRTCNLTTDEMNGYTKSIMAVKELVDTEECRWKAVLKYFGEEKDSCKNNCDACLEESLREEVDITSFAKPILQFLQKQNVMKSQLQFIVKGSKTKIEALPYPILVAARSTECIGIAGKAGVKQVVAMEYLELLCQHGYINPVLKGKKTPVLACSTTGKLHLQRSTPITIKTKREKLKHNISLEEVDLSICKLQTQEDFSRVPEEVYEEHNQPRGEDDIKEILHNTHDVNEDVLSLAIGNTVLRGNIALDFEEENKTFCVPKDLVENLICKNHKQLKDHAGLALSAYQAFPKIISWRVKKHYLSNKASNQKTYLNGISFRMYCSSQKDGCQAVKVIKSIGVQQHDGEEHVIFQSVFQKDPNTGILLNRHIHAQGSKLSKYHEGQGHKKVEARECCTMKFSDIPENYREIPQKLFNPFDKTSSENQGNPNPVLLFMTENQRQYEEDALIAQLGARNATYTHAQYMRRLETDKARPWLVGEDQNLTALGKVEKLKNYIDQGGFHLSSWHNKWINQQREGD